jgi:hypothetical protein
LRIRRGEDWQGGAAPLFEHERKKDMWLAEMNEQRCEAFSRARLIRSRCLDLSQGYQKRRSFHDNSPTRWSSDIVNVDIFDGHVMSARTNFHTPSRKRTVDWGLKGDRRCKFNSLV